MSAGLNAIGSLVVIFVFFVLSTVVDEEAVRLCQREYLVGVGTDRVIRDAFEQGVPYLFGCRHDVLLAALIDDRSRSLRWRGMPVEVAHKIWVVADNGASIEFYTRVLAIPLRVSATVTVTGDPGDVGPDVATGSARN